MPQSTHSLIRQIRNEARKVKDLSVEGLREASLSLKYEVMSGRSIKSLIPQGFGLVVEAARRHLGYSHYDVQLACGIELALGNIAEMKTGEGKTLTATLPAFLHALAGRGAHVVTINDYLAKRDRDLMLPVYQALGLSSGVVISETEPHQRKSAYKADITYGTAKEFGFDFLRDRLAQRQRMEQGSEGIPDQRVTRGLHYVLVDEADSILIDEAGTPLIIGLLDHGEESTLKACYQWAAKHAPEFMEDIEFSYDHMRQRVQLTAVGRDRVRRLPQNDGTRRVSIRKLNGYIENAIKVKRDFHLDRNYSIRDGEVVIIDEFTGRLAEGRQWQKGIHQSVEAKEKVEISPATRQAAQITVQSFFLRYNILSGMTGTAWTSRREFRKVYKKKVTRIPTHRPVQRKQLQTRVFGDNVAKLDAVVREASEILAQERSVLIGTRSVQSSELLSQLLNKIGIPHNVLNANNLAKEAEIVAAAGQPGAVTVATNMAGRGTDVKLDDGVREKGGLHVILTEIHESARIDWQLIGRGSRQGDPGTFRIFVSFDDEIVKSGLGPNKAASYKKKFGNTNELPTAAYAVFVRAQRKVERKNLVDRMMLLKHYEQLSEKLQDTGQDPYLDAVQS